VAVTTEQSLALRTGDGVWTEAPVPFPFPSAAALVVTLAGVVQTLGVDYTVTGGDPTGTVTMTSPPDDGDDLVIERSLPLIQETAFRDQGTFSPGVHEDALDYLTMCVQQVDRGVTDVATDLDTLDARVDDILADVGAAMVPDGGIGAAQLADDSVTTPKLADGGVTRPKLAPVGQQTSANATGTISTTSTAYVSAGGGSLTVTLTTTGRPVVVGLQPDGSGFSAGVSIYAAAGALSAGYVAFSSDGGATYFAEANVTTQGDGGGGGSSVVVPPGAFSTLWAPAAGTYTVTVYVKVSVATATLGLSRVKLFAYEL
jgi:hypothetical protein